MKATGLLLLCVMGASAQALEFTVGEKPRPPQATEKWLALQADGKVASSVSQAQTPKEREQSMQRWLDSYKYAIPDFYRWEKVNSSGQ